MSASPCTSPDVTAGQARRDRDAILRIRAGAYPSNAARPRATDVAKGSQPRGGFGRRRHRSPPPARPDSSCQPAHRAARRARLRHGCSPPRHRRQFVELGLRGGDVLPAPLRTARRPAQPKSRAAQTIRRKSRAAIDIAVNAGTSDRRPHPSASGGRAQDCRRHIDQRHIVCDDRAAARPARSKRHAQRRVVDEDAVADLAVLTECLAVIGGGHHQRRRGGSPSAARRRPASRSATAMSSRTLGAAARSPASP